MSCDLCGGDDVDFCFASCCQCSPWFSSCWTFGQPSWTHATLDQFISLCDRLPGYDVESGLCLHCPTGVQRPGDRAWCKFRSDIGACCRYGQCVEVVSECCRGANEPKGNLSGTFYGAGTYCQWGHEHFGCDPDTDPNCIPFYCTVPGCCMCSWCCDMAPSDCRDLGGIPDNADNSCLNDWSGTQCTGFVRKPRCQKGLWAATKNRLDSPEGLEPAPRDYFEISSVRAVAMIDRTPGVEAFRRFWGRANRLDNYDYHSGLVCGLWDRHASPPRRELNRCAVVTQTDDMSLGELPEPGYSAFGCAYRCACPEKPC